MLSDTELLKTYYINMGESTIEQFQGCGVPIYRERQPAIAGVSGPGCSATVVYGHLLN